MKNKMSIYLDIEHNVQAGAQFEQRWYESVIMILTRVRNQNVDPAKSRILLFEICDGLTWIKSNLNPKLHTEHKNILIKIFDICILIAKYSITSGNLEYLDIVITSLKVVAEPYGQI